MKEDFTSSEDKKTRERGTEYIIPTRVLKMLVKDGVQIGGAKTKHM